MVKICQTGLLKLNFETRPKKRIFRFLPKISAGHGWSWKFFFANFQILGPLGCQGWVAIPQNVKKVKITAPYSSIWIQKLVELVLHNLNTKAAWVGPPQSEYKSWLSWHPPQFEYKSCMSWYSTIWIQKLHDLASSTSEYKSCMSWCSTSWISKSCISWSSAQRQCELVI
jgi:hypothetical protein